MNKVAVLTDSCASIPEALLKELDIHWVAYYIHRGQEVLRDLVTIQRDEFVNWLTNARILPTTAAPGPHEYLQQYEKLADEGVEEIVSIHMTSKASGAYQSAIMAQAMAKEALPRLRIEVIDTLNVSLCQGWMVIEAARAAMSGVRLDKVAEKVKQMIPVSHMIMTADTLKYLYMGGRIGKAQHLMGTLLNIKPLIGMEGGEIVPLGTARSRFKAYQAMADLVEKAAVKLGQLKVAYVHVGARQEVETLKDMVEARLSMAESLIAELSPVLAVHSGPGTVGLCYYPVSINS